MIHRICSIKTKDNCELVAVFQNGIEKKYDVKQLFSTIPCFQELEKNHFLFKQVRVDAGGYGVSWNDNLDLAAEELWENGVETGTVHEVDFMLSLGNSIIEARNHFGMTQKELSERVGMYQAEISKIERGLSNPSISTLQRIAEGMGLELCIEFKQKSLQSSVNSCV